ncbi:hypothetical protein BV98_002876 [Sphingobium herbicidovorans NBRC 16415]|uniref:Uncharacterized protein n=1 Tax=Sphingobium herbicidovorans (strain ATCC 700291 / DSM 11019 / CCUG 56400 / KCTC 2939 / LMG 18315 / NBRC 16415 / MH) TaxID=1219045 RepID=A0A086P7G6_SPHHM|nr:hypothetical protein BV98_002876 [Sphingobium herbicidovorans NBRC 16415]
MTERSTVLVIGTADTKADEMKFLRACIEKVGGRPVEVARRGSGRFGPCASEGSNSMKLIPNQSWRTWMGSTPG